ncbi:MAG TPA: VWA domain-containing protein [Thermoanaerobaculia bacterium]|nr:VWA domain-containing protein [Thermoanaerobaculia bacterium]
MLPRSCLSIRPLAVILLLGLGGTTAAGALDPPAPEATTPPAGSFRGSAEVQAIEVPVQVLRGGQPVRGLTAADFEVWAGKEKQRIVGFDVVDVDSLAAAGPGPAPVTQLPASARRHFLFLFDLSQSNPTSLVRAQRAALQLVRELSPADLAGVAVFSPLRGPRVLLGFTSDRNQVALALDTLGSSELVESHSDWLGLTIGAARDELATLEARPQRETARARATDAGSDSDTVPSNATDRARDYLEMTKDLAPMEERAVQSSARDRARTFARGMADLASLLQAVTGRKHVMLLSEGFASDLMTGREGVQARQEDAPGESVESIYRTDSDVRFGDSRLQRQMRELVDEMRRADCVIHAIDIAGIETQGRSISNSAAAVHYGTVQPTGRGDDSLFVIAKETGGTFFRNYNDLTTAMAGVLRATAVTYVLTIQPEHVQAKEGYVTLRVAVRGGGQVSARPGYYLFKTPTAQQALQERLRIGAQVLEGRAGGAVHAAVLGVPLGAAGGAAGPLQTCAVVEVDGASLLEGHVGDMASAEVTVYAFDAGGSIHAVARQLVGLDLRVVGERLRAAGFKLFANLDLPPGKYQLRALVRNTVSNRYGIATGDLEVPAAAAAGAALAAVFVEPPGRDWLLVRDNSSGQPQPYPFTLGERVMVPAAAPRLHAGEPVTIWLEAPAGAAQLQAVVRRADGAVATTAALRLGARQPEAGERVLATFSPAGLAPGGYTLEVRLAEGGAAATVPFSIW